MYTIQDIAQKIIELKPDFTEFRELLYSGTGQKVEEDINNTQCIYAKLLKAELAYITFNTHAQKYGIRDSIPALLSNNIANCSITHRKSIGHSYYIRGEYSIEDKFKPDHHIIANIPDPKPYISKYLWNKVRANSGTQKPVKNLEPNLMSLTIFKHYLSTLKKMQSTEALKYIEQIRDFESDIRSEFLDAIFSICKEPSINLQSILAYPLPDLESLTKSKYMVLSRLELRYLARTYNVPSYESVWDQRDSDYKPFITGVPRQPSASKQETSALFSSMIVLSVVNKQTPNEVYQYFIEEIREHLKDPAYKAHLENMHNSAKLYREVLDELL